MLECGCVIRGLSMTSWLTLLMLMQLVFRSYLEPCFIPLRPRLTNIVFVRLLQSVSETVWMNEWICYLSTQIHTHTHPFNSHLSRTTQVSRYQKGKTYLDFTEARDCEWQWHQLGHMHICRRSRQITTPAPDHSVFYRPDALPATQPTAS